MLYFSNAPFKEHLRSITSILKVHKIKSASILKVHKIKSASILKVHKIKSASILKVHKIKSASILKVHKIKIFFTHICALEPPPRGVSHIDMVYIYVPALFGAFFREIWYRDRGFSSGTKGPKIT